MAYSPHEHFRSLYDAYTGAGSVITKDVAPDALALARGHQVEKPGWAADFRARKLAEKAARK